VNDIVDREDRFKGGHPPTLLAELRRAGEVRPYNFQNRRPEINTKMEVLEARKFF
jgi:hypothetical protein